MRIRDNSRVVSIQGEESEYDGLGGLIYSRTVPRSVVSPDVMSDVLTPGFSRISRTGGIIISPMTKHVGTFEVLPSVGTLTGSGGESYRWSGQWLTGLAFEPPYHPKVVKLIDRLESLAVTEAYAGVGSPDVALLTELAELKETLGFLASPVKKMVSLAKRFRDYKNIVASLYERDAIRRARWDKLPPHIQAKRTPPPAIKLPTFRVGKIVATDLSSAWLAFRYGLMPLIYTFEDVQKLLKKRIEGTPLRVTARNKQSSTVDLTEEKPDQTLRWHDCYFKFKESTLGSCRVTSRAGVLYEVDATLQAQLGLQLNRVPAAMYEVIPLSFVADWFYNGSKVYDALTAEARAGKLLAAWVVTTVDYDLAFTQVWGPSITPGTAASGFQGETYSGKWKSRRPASLSDVSIKFTLDLNSKRIADGLALIHTILLTGKNKK